MYKPIRFSTRSIFLLTAVIALAISIALAWPRFGSQITAVWFWLSLLVSATLILARRTVLNKIAFRIAILSLFTVVLLFASFGPATWAMARFNTTGSKYPLANEAYRWVYHPIATNLNFSPKPLRNLGLLYTAWWMPNGAQLIDYGDGFGWNVPGWSYTIVFNETPSVARDHTA